MVIDLYLSRLVQSALTDTHMDTRLSARRAVYVHTHTDTRAAAPKMLALPVLLFPLLLLLLPCYLAATPLCSLAVAFCCWPPLCLNRGTLCLHNSWPVKLSNSVRMCE